MSDLWVLIPVYQAADTVGEVVERAARVTGLPVLVIDDGSSDGSGDRAEAAGAKVLRHPCNHGKGAALQTGFAFAEQQGARAVLTLDADLQHDPDEAPALVEAHRRAPEALVVGVRRFDPTIMPGNRRFGNAFSTWWISRFAGRTHQDTQSGFRVYPRRVYAGARWRTTRFDTETELLLRAAKMRVPLVEVPIRTIYSENRRPSHFHGFHDSMRILRLILGSPWWREETW